MLLSKVFSEICFAFGWKFAKVLGKSVNVPDADVVLFAHSLVDLNAITTPYVGAHFIRDPRDIIVSGYLYHKRCKEKWCTNTRFNLDEPILFPNVPYSQEHRSEEWKRRYVVSLGNRSYQQNLRERTESDGLLFELHHYGAWTIDSMLLWPYNNPRIKELRFETVMSHFDETFREMFVHFGFSNDQVTRALQIAAKEDLGRLTEKQLKANPHISSRQTTKWHKYFKDVHKEAFKQRFGDALVQLGYEKSDHWRVH